MRKQLKMFAGFGMVAIAVCVLGTLYFQYSSVLVTAFCMPEQLLTV